MLENVYYINLAERKDRKELVENELNELGWDYERFNAIKNKIGIIGCGMSHLKLIRLAKEKNLDYIVVLEDDIQFMRKSWYNEKIKNILDNNFDVFLLGGNLKSHIYKINEDICKITKSFTTTGYIVKKHYYDILINNLKNGLELLLKNIDLSKADFNPYALDVYWMKLQEKDNWLIIMPRTITQRPIYSDIEQRYTDYNHLMLDDMSNIPEDISKNINLTLTSCFYVFNCKFTIETYKKWAKNLIDNVNNFNLVIYTDNKSKYFFNNMNINNNIKLIIKEIDSFKTYKYKDNWIKNHEQNTLLNSKVDWKVNMLWNEKINFVNETINNKYFKTKYYGWCDIGYFRCNNNRLPYDKISNWPNKNIINNLKDKIYYAYVCSDKYLNDIELYKKLNNEIPPGQCSIAGGFFISNKDNLKWWNEIYYEKIEKYFDENKLIKDDQIIIIDLYLDNKDKFKLITQKNINYDLWFAFDTYLL